MKTKRSKLHKNLSSRFIILIVGLVVAVGGLLVWRSFAAEPFSETSSNLGAVQYLGTMPLPSPVRSRDGGGSLMIGGKIVWFFGDTIYKYNFPERPADADIWRTATSSVTSPNNPFADVYQPADDYGNPHQLIPFSAEESEYNHSRNNVRDHYALWPSGQASIDGNTALIFFKQFILGSKASSTGVAILRAGESVATRQPGLLFSGSDPTFRKAMVNGGYVYLYATECAKSSASQTWPLCPVARAPLSQATNRAAYTFWNGSGWTSDIAQSRGVIPVSNYGYTVMWNSALNHYVTAIIGNLSHQVYFSYAEQPQGPWSSPVTAFTLQGKNTYVPYFHPELGDGKTVYFTYSRDDAGSIDIMKLTFGALPQTATTKTAKSTATKKAVTGAGVQSVAQDTSSAPTKVDTKTNPDAPAPEVKDPSDPSVKLGWWQKLWYGISNIFNTLTGWLR